MNVQDFRDLFSNKWMTEYEVNNLFRLVDVDKNNRVDDSEWNSFYNIFLSEFLKCGKPPAWKIPKGPMACLMKQVWAQKFFQND